MATTEEAARVEALAKEKAAKIAANKAKTKAEAKNVRVCCSGKAKTDDPGKFVESGGQCTDERHAPSVSSTGEAPAEVTVPATGSTVAAPTPTMANVTVAGSVVAPEGRRLIFPDGITVAPAMVCGLKKQRRSKATGLLHLTTSCFDRGRDRSSHDCSRGRRGRRLARNDRAEQ